MLEMGALPPVDIYALLYSAYFWSTHGGAKKRGENAEVKQPGNKRHETDDRKDDATHAMDGEQSQGDEEDASDNTGDAPSGGSHEFNKGVHFISPI
jgi:hypothetical protein